MITPVDPDELAYSPAFAQGVIAPAGKTVYVGGQLGTDSTGAVLDGIEAQTVQAMENVFAASRPVWGDRRTAITVVTTAGHARPGALVEIDAIAVVPE